jgi:hypothetical protein
MAFQRRLMRSSYLTGARHGGRAGLAAALFMAVASTVLAADVVDRGDSLPLPEKISFNEHIRPIFAKHCVACHGGVKQASGVSFIYREEATSEGDSGLAPISPGSTEESYLLDRVSDPDPETRMPPADHGPPLSERQIALLTKWIEQGAPWELHWSLVAPKSQPVPAVRNDAWPRNPLDRFVLAKLEEADLTPAAEADRATWLRRVSLDLIGLPPSPEEYAQFELDNRPDAYERVVDRLLASPHFGERWASMWLDLARYADTVGYERDPHRDIWPYRDWLIRALNEDLPFDEFTIKQLSGDLLPDATLADRLATAFNRNTQTNTEGGTDDEEFRTVAVLDRVSTVWQVWQGTTFGCTQCHSHPYDPFRHEEYYKFVALFNTSRDVDLEPEYPLLAVPNDVAAWDEAQNLDAKIDSLRRQLFDRHSALADDAALWRPLRAEAATASGDTRLVIRDDPADGAPEVVAEGTIPAESRFTIDLSTAGASKITALRIDALPKNLETALKTPESGFVVSWLQAELVSADGAELGEITFAAAACDEADPQFDPESSFRDDIEGWGDYTKQTYPRHAVFIPEKPVEIPLGARLRLKLQFKHVDSGGGALYIHRSRFAVSESNKWSELVGDAAYRGAKEELAALAKRRGEIPSTAVPVMAEQARALARRTCMFARGNWLDKEKEVQPGVPAVMPPLPDGVRADRLAMARWLVSPENPLTARVLVNRLWQQLFGLGIVETAEDFGTSGMLPSHPELLDYLALRLEHDHSWSVKKLLRDIVRSSTYRQDGTNMPEKLDKDPRNIHLSRGPRTRLTAEMIRDQALVLSGRFSPKMYGKPVMPPQPEGVWRSVYNGAKWETSDGEDRFRRAVYTYWKRTSGYPSMMTFDAPSRDVCVVRRVSTNTPLQALVTLNDQAFVELAQGFADRMEKAGGDSKTQLASGYRAATGRAISSSKLRTLVDLYDEAAAVFDKKPDQAATLAATREKYALTVVANALLNLDEVLTK